MINDSRNIFSQNNSLLNPNNVSNMDSNSDMNTKLGYSSSDQVSGPKIDNIYKMLGKIFKSYETLVSNYEVVVSVNTDFYANFLDKLENDEGMDVGNITNDITPPENEKNLANLPHFELIKMIKSKDETLRKCNQAFKNFQQLLGVAKSKIDEQKQNQATLTTKARSILRAYHKKDGQLLQQLHTSIPVANKPSPSSSIEVGNIDSSGQPGDVFSQDALKQAEKESFESRSRAIGAEQNVLGSTAAPVQQPGSANSSPFLNLSEGVPLSTAQPGPTQPLLSLGNSSGVNMESQTQQFRDLEPVEMISTNKEKGIILSGQPIGGSGDFLRYRVLFKQNPNIILKYMPGNSLKRTNYQTDSFSWSGKIKYILKHNIMSDFNTIKKNAHDIWMQPESNRLAALEMINEPYEREMITQFGIFKKRKSVNLLSPMTEDVLFIKYIPQGFENQNLIRFSFPDSVEKGMFDIDIYVIQLATQNPQNVLFYNIAPNDIIDELMRQWAIFIHQLSEKENQLKIIYENEHQNIKGFTSQAFYNKIKNKIHNFAVSTLNSVDGDASQKYGIKNKTDEIKSEKEYVFFKNMLDLSYNIYNNMHNLMESYNKFGLSQIDRNPQLRTIPNRSNNFLSGGDGSLMSRKNNKIRRRLNKKSSKHGRF